MTKKIQKIITTISFVFLGLCFSVFIWEEIYIPKAPKSQETKIFSVASGQGTKEISTVLKKQGLIKNGTVFRLYTLTMGTAAKLQAGDYLLSPSMKMSEIAQKMAEGDVVRQKITIIEGWNLRDISSYLEEQGVAKAAVFFVAANPPGDLSGDFDFLKSKPENLSLEGYLFPDTYEIQKGEDSEELVNKMLTNFGKKVAPYRNEFLNFNKTIFEIITMASLIEKEVKTLPDKKMVSGILWKRLENKMPLQVDATINYITGKKNGKVSLADTQIDSPYNTYKYRGLPLGPIANPGLGSILAALSPQESEFWYYLSTPEGETIFSATLQEHNAARVQYLK